MSRPEGLYPLYTDHRIGRVLVYEERCGREVLVGSMGMDPSEDQMREMCRRLAEEAKRVE